MKPTYVTFSYAEARRRARKLLGDNAELKLMNEAPALKYQIGVRIKGVLALAGAGNSWGEALIDAEARLIQRNRNPEAANGKDEVERSKEEDPRWECRCGTVNIPARLIACDSCGTLRPGADGPERLGEAEPAGEEKPQRK